ncbi:hypothetical protein C9374_013959 [Naegleria lovaniensis]|uniref:Uncharacterized protein n=1 Tax=Naegleria lovaniensis TaxID=51637 RepID=A0AA88H0R0_NAELO|nr:uncharacterized protein C9374_013959 [Naegleria lovaniensis]KAG2389399.1 hypothetical protein C9374_013959 [Naegleria lovaniensis]
MFYFYKAFPVGIISHWCCWNDDWDERQPHSFSPGLNLMKKGNGELPSTCQNCSENHSNHVQFGIMSPLMACWRFHTTCYEYLDKLAQKHENVPDDAHLVRFMFYKLEEQMNPIVFRLCKEWWKVDYVLPKMIARALFLIAQSNNYTIIIEKENDDEQQFDYHVDMEMDEVVNRCGKIVDFIGADLHCGDEDSFKECLRRLAIVVVNRKWSLMMKQAVLLIYLSCLCDRYVDKSMKNPESYPYFVYRNEIFRLMNEHGYIPSTIVSEISKCTSFHNNSMYQDDIVTNYDPANFISCVLSILEEHDLQKAETSIVSWMQFMYSKAVNFAPQLRQLSFSFRDQQPFGDCQELNIFELFINQLIFNTKDRKYDWSLLPSSCQPNSEIVHILSEFDNDPQCVNSLSFREKWHHFLQGKPSLFQYVNSNDIGNPSLDYELEVTIHNILSCAEHFFGITLEKFKPVKKFMNFDVYLEMRKSKAGGDVQLSEEEVDIIKRSKLRFCQERGNKKEKKWLEQSLVELGQQLSTPQRHIEFTWDKSTSNHNKTRMKCTDKTSSTSFEIICDQYGAHVATYFTARKNQMFQQFFYNSNCLYQQ